MQRKIVKFCVGDATATTNFAGHAYDMSSDVYATDARSVAVEYLGTKAIRKVALKDVQQGAHACAVARDYGRSGRGPLVCYEVVTPNA